MAGKVVECSPTGESPVPNKPGVVGHSCNPNHWRWELENQEFRVILGNQPGVQGPVLKKGSGGGEDNSHVIRLTHVSTDQLSVVAHVCNPMCSGA